MPPNKNNLIIFTGPSGVGKGTIVDKLFQELTGVEFSVSCTTRKQRPKEKEGEDYFFVSVEHFKSMIENDDFLEWAEFVGNYYGTPKSFVKRTLEAGKDVFLEIEVQGALQVMDKCPEAISIFLIPPGFDELEARLRGRGTESEEILQQRLQKAREEMNYVDKFQHVVLNDNIDKAVESLKTIILGARL